MPKEAMKAYCAEYEQAIEAAGGIDLQILGIGTNGHIGFNEPGSSLFSKTRLTPLENSTRLSNAGDFTSITRYAAAFGYHGHQHHSQKQTDHPDGLGNPKAAVIQKSVEGPATEEVPASLLQQHEDTLFVTDQAAAALTYPFYGALADGGLRMDKGIYPESRGEYGTETGKTDIKSYRQGL